MGRSFHNPWFSVSMARFISSYLISQSAGQREAFCATLRLDDDDDCYVAIVLGIRDHYQNSISPLGWECTSTLTLLNSTVQYDAWTTAHLRCSLQILCGPAAFLLRRLLGPCIRSCEVLSKHIEISFHHVMAKKESRMVSYPIMQTSLRNNSEANWSINRPAVVH